MKLYLKYRPKFGNFLAYYFIWNTKNNLMWSFHRKWVDKIETYEKLGKCKQTEFFNVSEQTPTRKRTEAVNVNEHFLLKQLLQGDIIIVFATHSKKYPKLILKNNRYKKSVLVNLDVFLLTKLPTMHQIYCSIEGS